MPHMSFFFRFKTDTARLAGQRVTPAAVNTQAAVIPVYIMIEGRGEHAQTDTTGVPVKPLKNINLNGQNPI